MTDKQQDEALRDAYRRASANDADRPSAATRAAILAEAAAAARRNAPAANQRYWLRAVAGVAVLGIGVALWQQVDEPLPGDAPVVAGVPAPQALEEMMKAERAPLPPDNAQPARAAVSPQPFPASPSIVTSRKEATAGAPPPAVGSPSPPALAQNLRDDEELDEIMVTGARVQASAAERAGGVAPATDGGAAHVMDTATLLRQYFARQYQSDSPHSLWLVLNAAGEVVQSGELAPGQRTDDVAAGLARGFGDRMQGTWEVQTLRNARGQRIELAITRLR